MHTHIHIYTCIYIYIYILDLLPDKYWIKNCSKMFCTFFYFLGPKNPKKNRNWGVTKIRFSNNAFYRIKKRIFE